jgi:hypothetical protein
MGRKALSVKISGATASMIFFFQLKKGNPTLEAH